MELIERSNGGLKPKSEPLGVTVIGKTTYRVYRLDVGENSAKHGVLGNYALEGPRGATYFVTDLGKRYMLTSVACGGGASWTPSPRPLRGLTREHLAAFGVEV